MNESSQPPSPIIQCGLFVQSTYCASTYTQNNRARNELSKQYAPNTYRLQMSGGLMDPLSSQAAEPVAYRTNRSIGMVCSSLCNIKCYLLWCERLKWVGKHCAPKNSVCACVCVNLTKKSTASPK